MVLRVKHFLLFLLVYLNYSGYAQQLNFVNISNSLNLPSQETYSVTQDSKGYIWIATEQGFCRYDGKTTNVYDRRNGLPEGGVYSVVEDKKGRLWLLTSKGRILILENEVLKEASFSKKYQALLVNQELPYSLNLTNDNKLYISSSRKTVIAELNKGKLTVDFEKCTVKFTLKIIDNQLIAINNFGSFSTTISSLQKRKQITFNLISDRSDLRLKKIKITREQQLPNYKKIITFSNQHGYYVAVSNTLIHIKNNAYTTKSFPQRILAINGDLQGNIYIGAYQSGVYSFENGDISQTPIISLDGLSISSTLFDKEGNIWCSTLEQGILMAKNRSLLVYNKLNSISKPVAMMSKMNNRLYYSYSPASIDYMHQIAD